MKVYIFKGKEKTYGVTPDESGANLPQDQGPWKPHKVHDIHKTIDLQRGEKPRILLNTDQALDDIEAKGWHIVSGEIVFSENGRAGDIP